MSVHKYLRLCLTSRVVIAQIKLCLRACFVDYPEAFICRQRANKQECDEVFKHIFVYLFIHFIQTCLFIRAIWSQALWGSVKIKTFALGLLPISISFTHFNLLSVNFICWLIAQITAERERCWRYRFQAKRPICHVINHVKVFWIEIWPGKNWRNDPLSC